MYWTVLCANASSASPISARRLVGLGLHALGFEQLAGREALAAAPHLAASEHDRVAVLQALEQAVAGHVDERDAGLRDEQRAHVRVAAGARRRAVDDAGDAAGDEIFTRDAVEVAMVDDRDVARPQPLDEVLRALPEPRDPSHLARRRLGGRRGGS